MDFNAALSAWATAAAAVAAFCAVGVAWWQLRNLNSTLRMTSLGIVLQLESEMNSRKSKLDDSATELRKAQTATPANADLVAVLGDNMKCCMENWLNAVDRFAFCILHGYLADKVWQTEYRDLFAGLIKGHPDYFGPGSIYTNIIDVDHKWQRS
jgi:hypothetical protein